MFSEKVRQGINFKLFSLWGSVLITGWVLISVIIVKSERDLLMHSLLTKGQSLSSYVARLSDDPLIMKDTARLDAIVFDANQNNDEDIFYVVIHDAGGNLLTSQYASINYYRPRVQAIVSRVPKESGLTDIIAAIKKEEPIRELSAPIAIDTDTIGNVTIGMSESIIRGKIASTILYIIAISLGVALVLGAVLFTASKKILIDPITDLAHATSRLAKGNLSTQVKTKSTGELQMLVDSFNQMARDLEKTTVSKEYVDNIITGMLDTLIVVSLDGKIIRSNAAASTLLGFGEDELIDQPVAAIFGKESRGDDLINTVIEKGHVNYTEKSVITKDGKKIPVLLSASAVRDGNNLIKGVVYVAHDITERKWVQQEREVMFEFLRLVNESTGTRDLVQAATTFFQQQSGCEAVGIRLHEGEDFPYFEARGFPKEFVLMENNLCARDSSGCIQSDSAGNPVIECMCGNVICGRFDPSKPFFTTSGSFWTNSTTQLLSSTTEADRLSRTRNRCNDEGYESVALIPLRLGEQRMGLLQLNDRRKGVFSPEAVGRWERLAGHLSVALAKFRTEEELRASDERYRSLFDNMLEGYAYCRIIYDGDRPSDFIYLAVNGAFEKLTGLKSVIGKKVTDVIPGIRKSHPELFEIYGRVALTGVPEKFETFSESFGGWLSISVYSSGKGYFVAVFDNISERKLSDQKIQRQLQRLAALRDIDMAITSSLDLRISTNVILKEVISQLSVDAADILLLNSDTQTLTFAGARGFRTSALKHTRLRLGKGHAGRAALERRIIRIQNVSSGDDLFARSTQLSREGFADYFGVPLISKGQVKGVLEVFHRSSLHPDQEWLDFLGALGAQAAIAIDNAVMFNDVERSNAELVIAYETTLEGWSRALDYRDKETEGHSQRVTDMTMTIARAMGLSDGELMHIRRGALLHDIGKLGVPDDILLKPGKLTDEEWVIMKQHPTIAYELLSPITFLRKAIDIPYCHHEKWDGTGYPRGLKGDLIPLAARIFSVVDVWDALRSDRPYRPAWSREKTLEYINELTGVQFDPNVVRVFVNVVTSENRQNVDNAHGTDRKGTPVNS